MGGRTVFFFSHQYICCSISVLNFTGALFVQGANWYVCLSRMINLLYFFLSLIRQFFLILVYLFVQFNVQNLNLTISCLRGNFLLFGAFVHDISLSKETYNRIHENVMENWKIKPLNIYTKNNSKFIFLTNDIFFVVINFVLSKDF